MPYPLINRELLANLRLVHGIYNFSVMLLFFYQARLGVKIRRTRRAKAPLPIQTIRRHRKIGPVLASLGAGGFLSGLTLVFIDTGNIVKYPPHLIVGSTIVILLIATFSVSRKIRGPDLHYRNLHFLLGIAILCLYFIEVFLGVGVLL